MNNIKIDFVGKKMYKRGCTDISEPWNSKAQMDTYTYEVYDENYEDIRTQIKVIDTYSSGRGGKLEHVSLIRLSIDALLELQAKLDMYKDLSDEEKELMKKFKSIYK